MPYRVKVDQPNLSPGTVVFVTNLGEFKNGTEADVADDAVLLFEAISGMSFKEAIEKLPGFSIVEPQVKKETPATKQVAPKKEGK